MILLMSKYLTWKTCLWLFFLADAYFFWNSKFLSAVSTLAVIFTCPVYFPKQAAIVLFKGRLIVKSTCVFFRVEVFVL